MPGPRRGTAVPRRLLLAAVAFALFVLCDILLFGWLIFRTLSQQEIEQVLLETEREAQGLAAQIAERLEAGDGDLYTAIAVEQETQTYLDSIPRQRDLVRSIEIRDREGRLIFQSRLQATGVLDPRAGPVLDGGSLDNPELLPPGSLEQQATERRDEFPVPDVEAAIGELGTLVVGLSPEAVSARIQVLRRHLVRQTALVAVLTLALLAVAFVALLQLSRRARALEIQAAEAERQAAEAERLAYLGTLASGLAHEIRNPLNALSLNMQMMKEEIASGQAAGPTAGRLLSITRSEIERLERLVIDFLAYARPRPPERDTVLPAALFERVRGVLEGDLARAGATLETDDATGARPFTADLAQLTQLLLNLVQNALAAAQDAGRPPRLVLRARRGAGSTVLEVEDNGAGIPPADRERVFDLFYSTRKGGTGLGLAIVQRIARNHGGEVEVGESPLGGARFRVVLPDQEAAPPAAAAAL